MEPRYYGQVPFRGCSLMVKPQSSKLITRVRFPSSPPLKGSGASAGAFFYIPGMKGIAYACGFDSSRARNPHAPARYPLHKSRSRLPGIPSVRKYIPSRARNPHAPARYPLHKSRSRLPGIPSVRKYIPSRARNPHAPARYPLTAHPHNTPYKTKGDRGVRAQWK